MIVVDGYGDGANDEEEEEEQEMEAEDEEDDEEECDLPYPGFMEPVLYCLKQAQPPRSWALTLVTNQWFDRLTMFVILLNCITLGMYRPCEDGENCHTTRCWVSEVF